MADSSAIAIVSLVVAGSVSSASPVIASVAAGRRQRNEFEAKVVLADRKELWELFDQGGVLFEFWRRYSSAVRNAIGSELTPL